MKRKVLIIPLGGITRMYDTEDGQLLIEIYDDEVDQKKTLADFAQDMGYVIVEEVEYERTN